ncbi:hypothetical protein [Lunatibacter salilacus]|uniref:hypothetical protein n=1 Tax=Lunatibacter salilacus TaxID=2483804 RepID=UPI00131C17B9|nr:hypothetical protein [Lunatibacter salilacus]
MKNLKLYIAKFAFGFQILAFGSCQSFDENPLEIQSQIDASKGTAVLSLFEEIDMIALAMIQHESVNNRAMTLTVEDFCQETSLIKNINEKSITADFGDGCDSSKGVKRAGSIKVISSDNFWSKGSVTQIVLDSFYIDGVKVTGIRTLTNKGFDQDNRNLNFESVMRRGEVTWPMESALYTEYVHDRTISLPTGKSGFTFSLVGKTELTDQNGNSLLAEIVKPMVFQESCILHGTPTASSGSLAIIRRQAETLVVNFSAKCA